MQQPKYIDIMQRIRLFFIFAILVGSHAVACTQMSAESNIDKQLVWYDGSHAVRYFIQKDADPVVKTAAGMFADDMRAVTGQHAVEAECEKTAVVNVFELDKASASSRRRLEKHNVPVAKLRNKTDGFHISVIGNHIVVVGTNGRGAAYGLLELSRKAGVDPWIWWGDIVPERRNLLTIDRGYSTLQGASVEYRGVFINDEDWSLRPWSNNFSGDAYKRIFQLLMRLRANTVWPAMHEGTVSFFKLPGAKAVADSCGIVVGSSHCEPLLRSNTGEWDVAKRGRYNYVTNKKAVQDYWSERLDEVRNSKGGNMLTIGMRGIHDGSMEGVKTMQEKFQALQQVIDDQQMLIRKHLGNPAKQTQVFVPYKEVLDIYNMGLRVPDHVTLMWCDDNYGYLTRLSDSMEQKRTGGGGIYYHLSYWGRPHDYLWLSTTQPGLIYNELKTAYDHNVRKIWIANVHDPKVAGFDLELFLGMAWDIDCVRANAVGDYYRAWLCRLFGEKAGTQLYPAMREFYRLCGQRRPEFMGWNQVEANGMKYPGLQPLKEAELSSTAFGNERERYLERYAIVASKVKDAKALVRPELCDAYFAAIEYPVLAAEAHARKLLRNSTVAYQEIKKLTHHYNHVMANGKWNGLMDMHPRNLPVFAAPGQSLQHEATDGKAIHTLDAEGAVVRNACEYQGASSDVEIVDMLGHSMRAVSLPKGDTLSYDFSTSKEGDAVLRIAVIPTQPNDKGDLRFSVSIDGGVPAVFSLKEPFRSERWKKNVLRGQAVRELPLSGLKTGNHKLVVKALDEHIIVDQWMVDHDPKRKFYLFPAKEI